MIDNFDNLDSQQISDILRLVADEQEADVSIGEFAHTEFMRQCLRRLFMGGQFQDRAISEIPEMLQKSFILTGNHQVSELILDTETPLLELKRAKTFFGDHSKHEGDTVKKEVYVALYYAFIAAALVHCNKKITGHSVSDLHRYFERLLNKSWIPESIRNIYRRACDYLTTISSMDTKG